MQFALNALLVMYTLHGAAASAGTIYKCKNAQGTLLYQEKPCTEEAKAVTSWSSSAEAVVDADGNSSKTPLVIGQGNNGHYMVKGSVNDQDLIFMVDTGASYVTLPQWIGNSAGTQCLGTGTMNTGNGSTKVCGTIIKKLKFGNYTLSNVEAVIAPNLKEPLLGMNVLKRFRVEQDSGEMRISKKN